MKAVLLGSDLMYTRDGRLVPIEINTNTGFDDNNRVEKNEDWFTAENLISFLKKHNFTKIILDARNGLFRMKGISLAEKLREAFPKVEVVERVGIADMEDEETTFFLRVEYQDEAIIDSFCRDKVEFLKALALDPATRQDFVYKEGEEVFGEVKNFQEFDGTHPNYVLKYRYPNYNKLDLPAYYKFNSVEELMEAANEMEDSYFIMPCYLNEDNMWEGKRFVLFRQWSVLALDAELGTLTPIDLGAYTKLSGEVNVEKNKWEGNKLVEGRENYTSAVWARKTNGNVILEETDEVLMADGTWKKAPEVEEGDLVKSVDVPYKEGVDITKHTGDYEVSEEELREKSTFTNNVVKLKRPVESFADRVKITFEEIEEDWWDVESSSYMVEDPKDGTVEFREIKDLTVGDKVYLIDIESTDKVEYKKVTIKSLEKDRVLVTGYQLSVDGSHLFITKSQEGTSGYISHNAVGTGSCSFVACAAATFFENACDSDTGSGNPQETCSITTYFNCVRCQVGNSWGCCCATTRLTDCTCSSSCSANTGGLKPVPDEP